MAGLGVSVCSYNMLGDTDVCRSNQTISRGLVKKLKHSDITCHLNKSDVHGCEATTPKNTFTSY